MTTPEIRPLGLADRERARAASAQAARDTPFAGRVSEWRQASKSENVYGAGIESLNFARQVPSRTRLDAVRFS